MQTNLRSRLILSAAGAVAAAACGCTLLKVEPPHSRRAELSEPRPNAPADFLLETVDLVDRNIPIGRVGDTWWGGQYNVVLARSFKDYLEAEVAHKLHAAGFKVHRYPGEFALQRLNPPEPVGHLRLELQELTLCRHPNPHLWADHVIAVCKIRGVLYGKDRKATYQRQFVGKVDTYRPTDELVPIGVGLFSRSGLSEVLKHLLGRTVADFRRRGIPEIQIAFREFRENADKKPDTDKTDKPDKPDKPDTVDPDEDDDDVIEF